MSRSQKITAVLPKDALKRVSVGHSFAEYDTLLENAGVFVRTPAMNQATASDGEKCLFVGRRGTGKTAITKFVGSNKRSIIIHPQTFASAQLPLPISEFSDTRQRPFNSLVHALKRCLLLEVLSTWVANGDVKNYELTGELSREALQLEEPDFDFRLVTILEDFKAAAEREKEWLKFLRRTKNLLTAMKPLSDGIRLYRILIDRIDEDWDGSDTCVVMLMALMHASVQLNVEAPFLRTLVFCRENIFERVREADNEFSRLETWIVSMDWTPELLLELVERRLLVPFNTKTPLGGTTWDHFFEARDDKPSYQWVFDQCQHRPRDVLMYVDYAIDGARARKHIKVQIDDLLEAKQKFSDSRLKDLGDEYSENFPQLQLVLNRFFGLTNRYTVAAIRDFIAALVADADVKRGCEKWLFSYTAPEVFIRLLYQIGFIGLKNRSGELVFRSHGARAKALPQIDDYAEIHIHPTFHDALQLRDSLLTDMKSDSLREAGILMDLPGSLDFAEYQNQLEALATNLKTIPTGDAHASEFEDLVGDIIRLCFFHVLSNVEAQSRDVQGRVRRDWIAANIANTGFWAIVRARYGATQVIWECKNYADLAAGDFHQMSYYLSQPIGGFGIIVFRGDIKNHYYEHIKRIADSRSGHAVVLLLNEKDLAVFVRQAKNGKVKDSHIHEIFNATVRKLS